jgi:putative phosphonate catabolism associated alcohol dehydrogenase
MKAVAHAAIFDGAGQPMRLAELPLPARLQDGEALVRLSLATICGSDLHTVQGRRTEPTPCVLGHEGVGVVVAAGRGREAWLDRRVTWTSADSCGECVACTELGLPQKCARVFKYGHAPTSDGCGLHGTYATHIALRRGTHLVAVPDELPDAFAAPANCALATMAAATEHLPQPCRVAVVQGAGLLGLYGCALLRAAGIGRVVVVDTDAARLKMVSAFGGEPALTSALPLIGPSAADLVIEVAGVAAVVAEGMKLLRPGGHYVLAGMVHPDTALALTGEAIIRGCFTLRGIHNYAPRHLDAAVAFLTQHRHLPLAQLVSDPLPLSRIEEALALAASRRWPRVALAMPD